MRKVSSLLLVLNAAVFTTLVAIWPWLVAESERIQETDPEFGLPTSSMLTIVGVGVISSATARVIHRNGVNPVGWVLHGFGLCLAGTVVGMALTVLAVRTVDPGGIGRVIISWVAWGWAPALILLGVFLPLLFPTGRPPSARWRWVAWVGAATMLYGAGAVAVHAWTHPDTFYTGALDLDSSEWSIYFVLMIVGILGALSSVAVRFYRGGTVERQQLKWVFMALLLTGVFLAFSLSPLSTGFFEDVLAQHLIGVVFGLVFASIGFAMTKYRLFEIDRIISRTLAYSIIVVVLGGVYFGTITALTTWLPTQNALAVAASTLAVAALFNPFRKAVQRRIDRRFNRAGYHAEVASTEMATRLRGSLTSEDISQLWATAVLDYFQPTALGVWISNRGHQVSRGDRAAARSQESERPRQDSNLGHPV